MSYRLNKHGNVSALVQIFNAIPSPSFSAPAELRIINSTKGPHFVLILIAYFLTCRVQHTLGGDMGTSHSGTPYMGSIFKTVMILNLAGNLKRKPSGGERAWKASFAGRLESEPRNKLVFLAGENQRADVSDSLPVALSRFWRCLPLDVNICFLSMKNYRVALNETSPMLPSKDCCERLNFQFRFDISILFYYLFIFFQFGTKTMFRTSNG